MDFGNLFSKIAKEGRANRENDEFIKKKFPQASSQSDQPKFRPLSPSPQPAPAPQLRQPSSHYSYAESRRASPPAARPAPASSSQQSSAPKPAGGYGSLLSNIAKEGMTNKDNKEFLQRKFPQQAQAAQGQNVPLGSSTNPQINRIISNRANPAPGSSPKGSGMTNILSSMAKESIAFQESKKQGFVQSFGPTPREQASSAPSPSYSRPAPPHSPPPARPASSGAPKGITGLFSSMAQESIAYQESKKQGFVQSFGPTPRDNAGSNPQSGTQGGRPAGGLQEKPKKFDDLKERNIIWLSEIGKNDIPLAGGKGANLAEMFNTKLPVPQAFIVTAKAYRDFVEQTRLKDVILSKIAEVDMENTAQLESVAKEIQHIINSTQMPRGLSEEIIDAYDDLNIDPEVTKNTAAEVLSIIRRSREPQYVAVRSSATTEDLEGASFAGQQETYLNMKGNVQLLDAVKRCWASLFTARAVYYRTKRGFRHDESFIAVVVQKMVESEKSGVSFSINPSTNNQEEIVIEAVFGLGEGIVSGTIAPDRYIIDKKTMQIKERVIASKPIYITKGRTGATVAADLPLEKQKEAVLDTSEILRLADYSRKLEEHYGVPQDTEWAVESKTIYIVQTRPVTTYKTEIKNIEVSGDIIVEGLGASPGLASGTVRIIHDLKDLSKIRKGDILVTEMTNPDMVVSMQKASAIVTDEGGITCHAAIVSREVGIPAIVGTRKATKILQEGQLITVDAYHGKIYEGKVEGIEKPREKEAKDLSIEEEDLGDMDALLNEAETKEEVKEVIVSEESKIVPVEKVIEEKKEPQKTEAEGFQEHVVTKVYMNLSEPDQIDKHLGLPFDGIGLMRLEFMIASQIRKHPMHMIEEGKEEEYISAIKGGVSKVAKAVSPKPMVVRFSDFKSNEYHDLEGGEKYEDKESNPMIGFRGVSRYVSPEFEKAFRMECKAISGVRRESKNVNVMLPFVRTTDEVVKCLEIMKSEGLERSKDFKILLMAEVPSMALIPEEFARLDIDGVSIGSNDLTQLVLGIDRDSAILGRMGYFDERNKAVLMAIHHIIKGFKKHGKTVSICGQAPSVYPEMVEFLIREGIDSMSVNPDVVSSVKRHVIEVEKKLLLDAARKRQGKTF